MEEVEILKIKWTMELGLASIQMGEMKSWATHSPSPLHSQDVSVPKW